MDNKIISVRIWKFEYEEKKSLTSEESLEIIISNFKKKNG